MGSLRLLASAFIALALLERTSSAACEPPHVVDRTLPPQWRAPLDKLVQSAAEPGHPWSCLGGSVDLEVTSTGAVLRVARAGEEPIERAIKSPDDVLPLGQALLAQPLLIKAEEAPPPPPPPPLPQQPEVKPEPAAEAPLAPVVAPAPKEPRVFLGAAADARAAGDIAWLGPHISAGIPIGNWLPLLSVRYQNDLTDGAPLNEVSVALALHYRIPIFHTLELRAGPVFRGASVLRDLPRPAGEQSQLQARIGAQSALVIPLPRWAHVVVSLDADVVALSRKTGDPATAVTITKAFPTFTVGGALGLEVRL